MSIEPQTSKTAKKTELNASTSSIEKRDHFPRVFKDPPNAFQLLRTTYPSYSEFAQIPRVVASGGTSNPFRLFQFGPSGKNCEYIFRAVLFLTALLRERAKPHDITASFSMSKDGQGFKELAADLEKIEPTLVGVSGPSLYSLYERIIHERRNLDVFLSQAVGVEWRDTALSCLAKELVKIDNEIKARDNRQRASKDTPGNVADEGKVALEGSVVPERNVALEGNVPAQESPEVAIIETPKMESTNAVTTQQITKHTPSGGDSTTNIDQKSSALPSGDSESTSSALAGGAAITVTPPSSGSTTLHSLESRPATMPIRPANVAHVVPQVSVAAQQLPNQGPQSPSSSRPFSASPSPGRTNDRKRAAAASVDLEIVKYLREEIFGIIRSEIERVNLHHNEARAEIVNINARQQRLDHALRTEIEKIKAHQQRLEAAIFESQKAIRSVYDANSTTKAYHDYQLAALGRDLRDSLDRIHAVEARVGIRYLPISPAVPKAAPPQSTNAPPLVHNVMAPPAPNKS